MTGTYWRLVFAAGQFVQYFVVICDQIPLYQRGIRGSSCIWIFCSWSLICLIAAVFVGGVLSSFWTSAHAVGLLYRSKLKFVWPVPVVMIGRLKMPFQYVQGLSESW